MCGGKGVLIRNGFFIHLFFITYLKKTCECHLKIILHRTWKQNNFIQSFFTCRSDEGNRTFVEQESITKGLLQQLLKKVINGGFSKDLWYIFEIFKEGGAYLFSTQGLFIKHVLLPILKLPY